MAGFKIGLASPVSAQYSRNPDSPFIVELEEGVRMVSWIIEVPAHELRLDSPVTVVFEDVTPEVTLPKFRRA